MTVYKDFFHTWSYSDAPGYRGHPKNSSATTQPKDHISIASQNGSPRIISGALKEKQNLNVLFYIHIVVCSLPQYLDILQLCVKDGAVVFFFPT